MTSSVEKVFAACGMAALLLSSGCGNGTTSTPTSTSNAYATAYQAVKWGSTVTATFPSTCEMKLVTTGLPNYTPPAYYLGPPTTTYSNVVASTPVSGLQLAVIPFLAANLKGASATFNICPAKASSTTTTNMGAIGYMISGVAMFNPYEATLTPALSDNVSYTFKDATGTTQTASFLDSCNMHPTPVDAGYTLHYHGIPTCVTTQVDVTSGPSHILGIALDGFPIYGGRDIDGNVIPASALDACNGITSVTPEFSTAAYHYVLPINVTDKASSLNCYAGSVSATMAANAMKLGCSLPNLKMLAMRQHQAQAAKRQSMGM